MFKALLTALGLGALLYFGPRGWAQQPVGAISYLYGSAKVQRAPDTLNAILTMPVELHDQVSTAAASTLTINLVGTSFLPKKVAMLSGLTVWIAVPLRFS